MVVFEQGGTIVVVDDDVRYLVLVFKFALIIKISSHVTLLPLLFLYFEYLLELFYKLHSILFLSILRPSNLVLS